MTPEIIIGSCIVYVGGIGLSAKYFWKCTDAYEIETFLSALFWPIVFPVHVIFRAVMWCAKL